MYGEEDANDDDALKAPHELAVCTYGCGRVVAHRECMDRVLAAKPGHRCIVRDRAGTNWVWSTPRLDRVSSTTPRLDRVSPTPRLAGSCRRRDSSNDRARRHPFSQVCAAAWAKPLEASPALQLVRKILSYFKLVDYWTNFKLQVCSGAVIAFAQGINTGTISDAWTCAAFGYQLLLMAWCAWLGFNFFCDVAVLLGALTLHPLEIKLENEGFFRTWRYWNALGTPCAVWICTSSAGVIGSFLFYSAIIFLHAFYRVIAPSKVPLNFDCAQHWIYLIGACGVFAACVQTYLTSGSLVGMFFNQFIHIVCLYKLTDLWISMVELILTGRLTRESNTRDWEMHLAGIVTIPSTLIFLMFDDFFERPALGFIFICILSSIILRRFVQIFGDLKYGTAAESAKAKSDLKLLFYICLVALPGAVVMYFYL